MDMPNNKPPIVTNEGLDKKFQVAKNRSFANYSFYLGTTNDNIEEIKATISKERYTELSAQEEWLLTITSMGYGKRSSAHEYRVSNRGGQGISAANLERRGDEIISCFPVEEDDQIILVTSNGQSIRCPVLGISKQSRSASGVKVFDTKINEKVVSVAKLEEPNE